MAGRYLYSSLVAILWATFSFYGVHLLDNLYRNIWLIVIAPALAILIFGPLIVSILRRTTHAAQAATREIAGVRKSTRRMLLSHRHKRNIEKRKEEIAQFIQILTAMDGDELGIVVELATDVRNKHMEIGVNLLDPLDVILKEEGIASELSGEAALLTGNTTSSVPLSVWVHTLTAVDEPQLRMLGRQMWKQLGRGFKYVDSAVIKHELITGKKLNVTGYDKYPRRLTPEPID